MAPWGKWFWSDWLADVGLRRSSYAAKGLWMDMLCIAAEADPIGTLVVNGEPLSPADIARMTGGTLDEVATLINELDRNGVLSRDRNGTIYNRRMVREAKRAKIARHNGKMGGNPSLRKDRRNSPPDNPPDKPAVKGRVKTHMPDARSQKERNIFNQADQDGFDRFWREYPSRGKASNPRKPAEEKFRRLVDDGVDPDEIIRGTIAYAAAQRDLGNLGDRASFVMQATRFLNQAVWRDYLAHAGNSNGAGSRTYDPANDDDARLILATARGRGQWSTPKWGPMPNAPGCRINPALVEPGDGVGWAEWGAQTA